MTNLSIITINSSSKNWKICRATIVLTWRSCNRRSLIWHQCS